MPPDIGQVNAEHGGGKLQRDALRYCAAAVAAGHDELVVAQHLGHQAMQEPRRVLDRGNFFGRFDLPGERKTGQRWHDHITTQIIREYVVRAREQWNHLSVSQKGVRPSM
jgi:hypothetical protein